LGYVVSSILESSAKCDYSFPEQLFLESFNYFKEDEFIEERSESLFEVIDDFRESESDADFQLKNSLNHRKYDHLYFVNLDRYYSENFFQASRVGKDQLSQLLGEKGDKSLTLGCHTFILDSRKAIRNFLNVYPVNEGLTIFALAQTILRLTKEPQQAERAIFESYNGNLKLFVKAFSEYSLLQVSEQREPSRNDFQDLLHLCYLRDGTHAKILTSDKLFHKLIPDYSIRP